MYFVIEKIKQKSLIPNIIEILVIFFNLSISSCHKWCWCFWKGKPWSLTYRVKTKTWKQIRIRDTFLDLQIKVLNKKSSLILYEKGDSFQFSLLEYHTYVATCHRTYLTLQLEPKFWSELNWTWKCQVIIWLYNIR